MKYWQYMEGNYVPQSPKTGRFCIAGRDDEVLFRSIEKQECKTICINDEADLRDFQGYKKRVIGAFEKILPEISSFERRTDESHE